MGRNVSPDELRTAQIQRQHSQEMAIRWLAINASTAKEREKLSWDLVVDMTDKFERDIENSVRLRDPAIAEVSSNGEVTAVASEEVISLDTLILLTEKCQGAPASLKPMIKNMLTSMGVKGAKSIEDALKQLTPAQADRLDQYIETQVEGVK